MDLGGFTLFLIAYWEERELQLVTLTPPPPSLHLSQVHSLSLRREAFCTRWEATTRTGNFATLSWCLAHSRTTRKIRWVWASVLILGTPRPLSRTPIWYSQPTPIITDSVSTLYHSKETNSSPSVPLELKAAGRSETKGASDLLPWLRWVNTTDKSEI